jgi:O-antigen/teichoic acid export membrane protein
VSFGAARTGRASSNRNSVVRHNRVVRLLLIIGIILLVLGIASLFVPIPMREKHGFNAGPVSVGVETTEHRKVHPAVSAVLIAGGVVLMIAGARKR